jgi:hypothetical protein
MSLFKVRAKELYNIKNLFQNNQDATSEKLDIKLAIVKVYFTS